MAGRRDDPLMVFSTERGLICPKCRLPTSTCRCGKEEPAPAGDGIARVRRETKGRGGKTVTVVYDLPRNAAFLKELSQGLKRACGVGGTVSDASIELQGDLRDRLRELLLKKGFGVKG